MPDEEVDMAEPNKLKQTDRVDLGGGAWVEVRGLSMLESASMVQACAEFTDPSARALAVMAETTRIGVTDGECPTDGGTPMKLTGEMLISEARWRKHVPDVATAIGKLSGIGIPEKKE